VKTDEVESGEPKDDSDDSKEECQHNNIQNLIPNSTGQI